ncbi:MAG: biopolymer transporter ExbB [Rhodobacteraceae bacterium]|nr:biopolymer transporter ExbB [Paracoccaceae bacterium]
MTFSEKKPAPYFSQPVRQILLMLIVVALVAAGAWLAFPTVAPVFLANPWLNGVIFGVFLMGVLACFLQVFQLMSSVAWIEGFAGGRPGADIAAPPRLLAPLANLLRTKGARSNLSASSTRSILESVSSRIEEARDITRYIVNLLIFLGLLGTFYGLATTVPAVVDTIRALEPQEGEEGMAVFDRLMTGLEAQLGGMGTAFSSSLLGLAGSLVVGLLELFAGHGQNRFYRELEEWLSSITRIGLAGGEGDGTEMGLVATILDQMAEQVEVMKALMTQADMSWAAMDERLGGLAAAVEGLAARMENEGGAVPILNRLAAVEERSLATLERSLATQERLVDGQGRLVAAIASIEGTDSEGFDGESRKRLRSIDTQLLRVLEEVSVGRQETLAELRTDIAQLTRAVRQLGAEIADGGRRRE